MKNRYLKIIMASVLIAVIVVVVLKLLGQENPTVLAGGITGGIVGAIVGGVSNKK